MAKNILSELIVQMTVENAQFQRELTKATARQAAFEKQTQKASMGLDAFTKIGIAAGVALAGLSVAQVRAQELENLGRISGLTAEEFLDLSRAAQTVGISSEKLGDIFKDTREKLGEFIATGGGGFADFFNDLGDKVGITAKELEHLSGDEVLIRVQNAMDSVNLSAAQQSFYLESIASDTTNLIPLLKNQGREFENLNGKTLTLTQSTKGLLDELGLLLVATDEKFGFSAWISDQVNNFALLVKSWRTGEETAETLQAKIDSLNKTMDTMAAKGFDISAYQQRLKELNAELFRLQEQADSTTESVKKTPEEFIKGVHNISNYGLFESLAKEIADLKDHQKAALTGVITFSQQNMAHYLEFANQAFGEASGIYKVLLSVQKAAAIPGIIIAGEEAAANALKLDPSGALSNAMRVQAGISASIVAGQAIAGVFHGGGAVPDGNHERTYLLKGGEYVESRAERRKIDEMLEKPGAEVNLHYTIHALDARGVERVLMDNADTVYNSVSRIFNRQGRDL